MIIRRFAQWLMWLALAGILCVLYLPLVPPFLFSISAGAIVGQTLTLRWYASLPDNPVLVGAIGTTLIVALVTALAAPALGLLAAMAVRELRMPRIILLLVLLPPNPWPLRFNGPNARTLSTISFTTAFNRSASDAEIHSSRKRPSSIPISRRTRRSICTRRRVL